MPERALILPPLRRTAADAAKFASIVHEGQTDKAGRPYVEHLWRVAAGALKLSKGCPFWDEEDRDAVAQIARLHDTIEDTDVSETQLIAEGFSQAVVDNVCGLTRDHIHLWGETYKAWIAEICRKGDLAAVIVKLADVTDNSDPDRLTLLPEADRERLTRKYAGAKEALQAAARARGWRG